MPTESFAIVVGILLAIIAIMVINSHEKYNYYGKVTEVVKCNYPTCVVKGELENGEVRTFRIDYVGPYKDQKFVIPCYKDQRHDNREVCEIAEALGY